jgi:hypothetical protein
MKSDVTNTEIGLSCSHLNSGFSKFNQQKKVAPRRTKILPKLDLKKKHHEATRTRVAQMIYTRQACAT